jgi:hypothetical protein
MYRISCYVLDGLGYYDDGEEVLGIAEDGDGRKRLQDLAKGGDSRMAKRARKLAEDSNMPKNSLLRHVQPGINNAHRGSTKDRARKFVKVINRNVYSNSMLCNSTRPS